jgi:mitochondrial intermediate peptidase
MLAKAATDALSKSKPAQRIFRFKGCLHVQVPALARRLSVAAAPPTSEDLALVTLFDQPPPPPRVSLRSHTGLFGHGILQSPAGFHALADSTLHRAHMLKERIIRAQESKDELGKVVKNLDRLSDMLCGVIDLAEFVRNSHPDAVWVDNANEVYEKLVEFMNVLNTDVGLYEVCCAPSLLSDALTCSGTKCGSWRLFNHIPAQ